MNDREIKGKIKNITDTVKITKAMQVIATTKIYGGQKRQENARVYLQDVKNTAQMAMTFTTKQDEWFVEKQAERSAFVIIAGDKGLCGDYNACIFSFADELLKKSQGRAKIFIIGYVGREYYKTRPYALVGTFIHHQLHPSPIDTAKMADELITLFRKGDFKDLYLIYTDVKGHGDTFLVNKRLLPLEYQPTPQKELFLGQKNADIFLRELIIAELYYAVSSAVLAVNYKRMAAMRQATLDGEEYIEDLKIEYNRTRQNKITNELNDAANASFGKKR